MPGSQWRQLQEIAGRAAQAVASLNEFHGPGVLDDDSTTDILAVIACLRNLGRATAAMAIQAAFDSFNDNCEHFWPLNTEVQTPTLPAGEAFDRIYKEHTVVAAQYFEAKSRLIGELQAVVIVGPGEPAEAGLGSDHPAGIGPADPERMAHMSNRGDDASRAALASSAGKGTGATEPSKDADGRAIVEEQLSQVPKHAMAELLFVLAQTYHRLLESVFFSPIHRTDLELNGYYLWVVDNLRHLVTWPELEDFGTAFEPVVLDLLPPSLWGTKWEGNVAASSMRFLAQAQQYCSNLKRPCPDDEPASKAFLSHFLPTCEEAIERAHRVEEEAKEVYAERMQGASQGSGPPRAEDTDAQTGQACSHPKTRGSWEANKALLRQLGWLQEPAAEVNGTVLADVVERLAIEARSLWPKYEPFWDIPPDQPYSQEQIALGMKLLLRKRQFHGTCRDAYGHLAASERWLFRVCGPTEDKRMLDALNRAICTFEHVFCEIGNFGDFMTSNRNLARIQSQRDPLGEALEEALQESRDLCQRLRELGSQARVPETREANTPERSGGVTESAENEGLPPGARPPNWSKPCSKAEAAGDIGISTDNLNDYLKDNSRSVHNVTRQKWQFDKNYPLFSRLP